MKKRYRFSELDRNQQLAVIANLRKTPGVFDWIPDGNFSEKLAQSTVWEFISDYPVDLAAGYAWDNSVVIFDADVRSMAIKIEAEGKAITPILIDDTDEEDVWIEGRLRAIAYEKLGLETIPALVRIA